MSQSTNQPINQSPSRNVTYVIITPARDEEAYIEKTIDSVVSQTIIPREWIILDDGSTDRTGELADQAAKAHAWIKAIHRGNRGFRKAGGGVIEAFYEGYDSILATDWQFMVKLDGDLSFGTDYFEKCFARFAVNPKLGIGGGMIYGAVNGGLLPEPHPMFHVRGATKVYRKACWEAIGGLIQAPGWDTLDEVKANMLGWETSTFNDVQVVHHRPTGAADGTWRELDQERAVRLYIRVSPRIYGSEVSQKVTAKAKGRGRCGFDVRVPERLCEEGSSGRRPGAHQLHQTTADSATPLPAEHLAVRERIV